LLHLRGEIHWNGTQKMRGRANGGGGCTRGGFGFQQKKRRGKRRKLKNKEESRTILNLKRTTWCKVGWGGSKQGQDGNCLIEYIGGPRLAKGVRKWGRWGCVLKQKTVIRVCRRGRRCEGERRGVRKNATDPNKDRYGVIRGGI